MRRVFNFDNNDLALTREVILDEAHLVEQHTHKEKSSVLAPWKFGFSFLFSFLLARKKSKQIQRVSAQKSKQVLRVSTKNSKEIQRV